MSNVISNRIRNRARLAVPALDALRFPASSQILYSVPPPRIDENDDETVTWLSELREKPEPQITEDKIMNDQCALCGRPAAAMFNTLHVDSIPVELCGPCLGLPVAVMMLNLMQINSRANLRPVPDAPQA